MSGLGLYDMITGHFNDGSEIESFSSNNQLIKSVLDNIQRILNSRQGSLKHLPRYGIPDLNTIYKNLPSSADTLKFHIRQSLLEFEPRLNAIDIQLIPAQNNIMVLCYQLVCSIQNLGNVRINTYFLPEGTVDLKRIV